MKNYFDNKKLIFSIVLILFLFLIFIYLIKFINYIFSIIYASAISLLLCIFITIILKKNNKLYNENQLLINKIIKLYKISNKILNVFFIYFDNSFLLFHLIFNEEKDLIDTIKSFVVFDELSNELKKDKIKEYLRDDENKIINNSDLLNINDLIRKLESQEDEINTFLDTIKSIENILFVDAKDRLETFINKENFKKLVVEYEYYSEIISDFINSIIKNINITSKPLSEEIYTIKQNVNLFIKKVLSWKEDLINEKGNKNFYSIMQKYNDQNNDFKNAFLQIDNHYAELENNLENIMKMIDKIFVNSSQIQDISEKISTLSINASIESTRAGEFGKGFKVISDEIQKLSDNTKTFTKNILSVINNTKNIALNTISNFEQRRKNTTDRMNLQKNEFESFNNLLKEYYSEFNDIFSSISILTDNINEHINKFNPIFQLHDISVQQLGNLDIMIDQYLKDNREEMDKIIKQIDIQKKKQILNKLFTFIEKKITTDEELEVLNNLSKKYNLEKEVIKTSEQRIELF